VSGCFAIYILLLLPVQFVLLGNKFQRVTEDSESRAFPAWSIAEKLMAEWISALATGYLKRALLSWFLNLSNRVDLACLCEGRPWRGMLVLARAREERI